jgi:hypothetical protein
LNIASGPIPTFVSGSAEQSGVSAGSAVRMTGIASDMPPFTVLAVHKGILFRDDH